MTLFDEPTRTSASQSTKKIFSVSELNRRVKDILEIHLPLIWVEGELSNLSQPSSGHWYFTLKDARAQVRCAMFRGRNQRVAFAPKAGDNIQVRARVSLYEGRGDYQLIVEHMEPAGFGDLQRQFEALKLKLHDEGLFDPQHKRELPAYPQHLAVVTSPTGAAIHDVLTVIRRRYPLLQVTIIPASVQGADATGQLLKGLQLANSHPGVDAIILCRGGGSLEDLWAFNDENLARAIFDSRLPVVSAVGHEVDFTISDFVADARGATPSAAAELITPDGDKLMQLVTAVERRLTTILGQQLKHWQTRLKGISARLQRPDARLRQQVQRIDEYEMRLRRAQRRLLDAYHVKLNHVNQRLARVSPRQYIAQQQQRVVDFRQRLLGAIRQGLHLRQVTLAGHAENLDIVSPLATLKRGYSIARDADKTIIRSVSQVGYGDELTLKVADGEIDTLVKDVRHNK